MAADTPDNERVQFELDDGDGVRSYDLPDILDLDMDEWIVVYEYAGLVLDDFAPLDDADAEAERIQKLRHPGFMKALIHVAYQRAHPKKQKSTVKGLIGNAKLITLLESMSDDDDEGDAADPPASTPEPAPLLPRSSGGSSASSSPASESSSDQQDDPLAPTGTSE